MAGSPTEIDIRPGDTKSYVDVFTDTETGEPIDADLSDGTWEATCQIRKDYNPTSPLIAEFDCEITGPNTILRTLTEEQSLQLDDVPFTSTSVTRKRKVYWDAQLRKEDGLGAGSDYVLTYLSGVILLPGQVTRAS